jgi:hypothetical protein
MSERRTIPVKLRIRRLLRRCKNLVGLEPALLPILLRLTPLGISRQISEQTELVVEGFPRSGNTFAVFALEDASGHQLVISSHVHHPAQIKYAVAHGVPTVLIVRDPVAALASYMIFGQDDRPGSVINEYISYHRQLVPYADHVLICRFDDVTTDVSSLIARINRRYDMEIPPFNQTPENVDQVFAAISRQHRLIHRLRDPSEVAPRPSTGREVASEAMRHQLLDPRHKRALTEAQDLYSYFSDKAEQQMRAVATLVPVSVMRMPAQEADAPDEAITVSVERENRLRG